MRTTITAGELIKELEKFDPDAGVFFDPKINDEPLGYYFVRYVESRNIEIGKGPEYKMVEHECVFLTCEIDSEKRR